MAEPDKYVRVYYSIIGDERFAAVYHDGRHLGTWLQLLLVADAMYPADAPIPAYVHRPSFRILVGAGLIEERPHQHYRVHGLASERGKRAQSARIASAVRWQSGRIADAMPTPSLAKQSIDEQSRAEQTRANGEDDPAVAFQERTGEFPGAKMLGWLNELGEAHGEDRLAGAIRGTPMTTRNAADYLRAVRDKLRAEDHAAEVAERADEKRRLATKRAPLSPVAPEVLAAVRAKYGEGAG